jgi:hypothetical protein
MVGGRLPICQGGSIVRAGDRRGVAEDADFHSAHRDRTWVSRLDLRGSLDPGLALALRRDGDPVVRPYLFKCFRIVISPHSAMPAPAAKLSQPEDVNEAVRT